jgi:uncharacterized protein
VSLHGNRPEAPTEETSTTTTEPVTVLEGRTLQPGHEDDYHDWVHRTIAASERFPGVRGITVLAPEAGRPGERYLVLSFVNEAAKRTWQQSEDWRRLRQEAATFSTPHVQRATGMEPWFVLPDQGVTTPPRWKMSIAIIPPAYVIGLAVVLLTDAFLGRWPYLASFLIVTVCLGFLLTYVGIPLSTRLLHQWLYPTGVTERES